MSFQTHDPVKISQIQWVKMTGRKKSWKCSNFILVTRQHSDHQLWQLKIKDGWKIFKSFPSQRSDENWNWNNRSLESWHIPVAAETFSSTVLEKVESENVNNNRLFSASRTFVLNIYCGFPHFFSIISVDSYHIILESFSTLEKKKTRNVNKIPTVGKK